MVRNFRKVPILCANHYFASKYPEIFVDSTSTELNPLIEEIHTQLRGLPDLYATIKEMNRKNGLHKIEIYQMNPDSTQDDQLVWDTPLNYVDKLVQGISGGALREEILYDQPDWGEVGSPDADQWIDPLQMSAAIRLFCEVAEQHFRGAGPTTDELKILAKAANILNKYGQEM